MRLRALIRNFYANFPARQRGDSQMIVNLEKNETILNDLIMGGRSRNVCTSPLLSWSNVHTRNCRITLSDYIGWMERSLIAFGWKIKRGKITLLKKNWAAVQRQTEKKLFFVSFVDFSHPLITPPELIVFIHEKTNKNPSDVWQNHKSWSFVC